MSRSWYNDSYEQAREQFLDLLKAKDISHYEVPLEETGLQLDIAVIGALEAENLLIHSSGLHGVEGYVGSAIQLGFLNKLKSIPENTCLIMCHILNPYGMQHNRRFNENNVDLNRNFIDLLNNLPENPKYAQLNALLNPSQKQALKGFKRKALLKILRHGFSSLQQAVGQGQYQFPKGVFYGGEHIEESGKMWLAFLQEKGLKPKRLVVLDVHCGLGKYGKEGLYLEGFQSTKAHRYLENELRTSIIHVRPNTKSAYQIYGGYLQRVSRIFPDSEFYGLTQEFGIASPLEVLSKLRNENFFHHYKPNEQEGIEAKQNLKQLFCPKDNDWRNHAVEQGILRLEQGLKLLEK